MTTPPRPDPGVPAPRYALDDFEQYLPPWEPARPATGQPGAPGAFVLRPDAQPPYDKMAVAMENDSRFKATWERRRRDLPDQSASGYAMALASAAVSYEWTDQEIVDLLVAFYRDRAGRTDKGRTSYELTLRTARRGRSREEATSEAVRQLADVVAQQREAVAQGKSSAATSDGAAAPQPDRAAALDALSTRFGLRFETIEKTNSAEPVFSVHTALGTIKLGEISSITRQAVFVDRIAAATDYMLPALRKNESWRDVAQLLLRAAVIVDIGDEAKAEVGAKMLVEAYIADRAPSNLLAEGQEHPPPGTPYRVRAEGGEVAAFITNGDFRQWMRVRDGTAMTARQVGMLLREAGGTPMSVRVSQEGVFRMWRVPVRNGNAIEEKL